MRVIVKSLKNNHRNVGLKKQLFFIAVLIIGCILIACGGYGLWQNYRVTHNPHPTITTKVITSSTTTPDETKPTDACANYKVGNQYPERLNMKSIGVNACIEQVGIDQHGAIAVPDNIYTVAWYVNSVLPGEPGLSVIDGHISGLYNVDAVFQYLDQIKIGSTFTVTMGGGKVYTYEVYANTSVPLEDAATTLLQSDKGVTSELNIITCGGEYNKKTKLYDHRVIIRSALLNQSS